MKATRRIRVSRRRLSRFKSRKPDGVSLGYTHNIFLQLPSEVKVETKTERNKNPYICLESCDKQLLGQVCAKIRSFRMPEPYKGKGILFVGEQIRRKSGKAAGAK